MEKDTKQICVQVADFFRKCHGLVFEASGVSDLVKFRDESMAPVLEKYESVKNSLNADLRANIDAAFAGMHAMGNEMPEVPDTLPAVLREAVEVLSDPDELIMPQGSVPVGEPDFEAAPEVSGKPQARRVFSGFVVAGVVIVVILFLGIVLVKNLVGVSSQEVDSGPQFPVADAAAPQTGVVDVRDPLEQENTNEAVSGKAEVSPVLPDEKAIEEEHIYVVVKPDLEVRLGTYGSEFFKSFSKVVDDNYTNLSNSGVLPAPEVQKYYDAAQAGNLGRPDSPEGKPKTYSQCLLEINNDFMNLAVADQKKIKTVPYFRIPADEERFEKFKKEFQAACLKQGVLVEIEQKRNIFFIGFKDYFATFTTIEIDLERKPGKPVYFSPSGMDRKLDVMQEQILSLSGHLETDSTKELIFYVRELPFRCTYLEWLTLKEEKKAISAELQHKVIGAAKDIIPEQGKRLLMEFRIKGPVSLDFDFLSGRVLKMDVEKGKFFIDCESFGVWIKGVKIQLSNFCAMRLYENSRLIMQSESDYAFESGKQYKWSVRAIDQHGGSMPSSQTRDFVFNDKASLPASFALFSPVKGRIMRESNKNIPLQWTKSIVPGKYEPITYHVWLSNSSDFSNYKDLSVIDLNGYTIRDSLSDGTYYWRVFAENPAKVRRWASQKDFFFVVKDSFEAPKAPVPLNPFIDEVVSTINPKLVAAVPESNNDTINPVSYLFEIDTSDKFDSQNYHASANVHPQKKGEVAWIPNKPLKENVRWYWRCRATNGILQSPFSSVSWFTPRRYGQGVEKINLLGPDTDAHIGKDGKLSWDPVQAPYDVRYTLIIDSRKNFFEPEFKLEDINADEIPFSQIQDKLKDNLKYYWMVKVFDPDTQELAFSSDIRSFYINFKNDEPSEFTLVAPSNGATLCFGNPEFFWTKSTDADIKDAVSYELTIYKEGEQLPVFTKKDITSTFYEMKYYKLIELKSGKADLLSKGFMKGKKMMKVGDSYKIEFDKIRKLS